MVSGKVNRASGSQSFIGKVDASGNVSFTTNNLPWLTVSGTNGVQLTLEVSNSSNGLTLQGKLRQSGSEVATTTARKTVAPTTSQKGRYTAAFQQVEGQSGSYPEGDGHATAFVSSASIAFIGRLADGSSASASMKLTESGAAPLFSPVYSGKGLISGAMTFAAGQDGTDASAIGVRWFRSANVTYPAGYRDGWPTGILVDLLAYKYVGTNGFGIANTGTTGLALKFLAEGGNLQSALNGSVSLSSKNVLTASPGTVKLTTTLNSATGIITGTFTTPNTTTPTKFSAVILQKTRLATGFFLNGAGTQAKSGVIQITE
jgi:hypothetical protein